MFEVNNKTATEINVGFYMFVFFALFYSEHKRH